MLCTRALRIDGKKVLEVQPQHDSPTCVRRRKGLDRPRLHKAMHGGRSGHSIQDLLQHLALHLLHQPLGRLDQPHRTRRFHHHPIVIVLQLRRAFRPAPKRLQVGKPCQFGRTQPQPHRQVRDRLNRRHTPLRSLRPRLHHGLIHQPVCAAKLARMLLADPAKPRIPFEESNHLALSRPCAILECGNVSASQRMEPAPLLPQHFRQPRTDRINRLIAREHRRRDHWHNSPIEVRN
jgi:hypothetical protein